MTPELYYLTFSVVLGLLHLIAASHLISSQYGYRWTASTREQQMPPLKGIVSRVDQAATNFLETFPLFAAVVIIAHFADCHGSLTLWGARLYFCGRLIYVCAAAAGYPMLRSMIWNVATGGIVLFIIAILVR